MALTRKYLSALGIEPEKIDEIITAHSETVTGLKEERDKYKAEAETYKADAEKVSGLEKKITDLEAAASTETEWKAKYDDLKAKYDAYKGEVDAKETKRAKETAYRKLLKEANVSEKRVDTVMKVTSLDNVELNDDGSIKDADKLSAKIKEEWSDFIVTETTKGANTATPPANNPGQARGSSRAAQLAAQYHENVYGKNEEE